MKVLDFSNDYSWKNFVPGVIFATLIVVVGVLQYLWLGSCFYWLYGFLIILDLLAPIFCWCRNTYTIQNNYLIIHEYNYVLTTLLLEIPMETILNAEVVWSWWAFKRVVRIQTTRFEVDLQCITKREELVSALNTFARKDKKK